MIHGWDGIACRWNYWWYIISLCQMGQSIGCQCGVFVVPRRPIPIAIDRHHPMAIHCRCCSDRMVHVDDVYPLPTFYIYVQLNVPKYPRPMIQRMMLLQVSHSFDWSKSSILWYQSTFPKITLACFFAEWRVSEGYFLKMSRFAMTRGNVCRLGQVIFVFKQAGQRRSLP